MTFKPPPVRTPAPFKTPGRRSRILIQAGSCLIKGELCLKTFRQSLTEVVLTSQGGGGPSFF
jgi:hypothetical protein